MIVADTGGVIALLDRSDRHHAVVRELFERTHARWILPWAILPEVDYLAQKRLGSRVSKAFVRDLRDGAFRVDGQVTMDLPRAVQLLDEYADLELGMVDAVVMAQAERHAAEVIVTLDARDFRAVTLDVQPAPRLVPLDP